MNGLGVLWDGVLPLRPISCLAVPGLRRGFYEIRGIVNLLDQCWDSARLVWRGLGDAGDIGLSLEGLGACGSILDGWYVVVVEREEDVDPMVSRQEPPRLTG